MKADIAILTIPISPPKEDKAGIFALCTVMDVLRMKAGAQGYICLNMQDSYTDRTQSSQKFLAGIGDLGMDQAAVWVDRNNTSHVFRNLEKLTTLGRIVKKEVTSLVCDCGRVDCKADSIDHIKDAKLIQRGEAGVVCSACNTVCAPVTAQALVFRVPGMEGQAKTVPDYLSKEMSELQRKMAGQEILISKRRPTGVTFECDGEAFNIDTDFCSFNYLSAFEEKNKVVVATSHVTYQMYMIDMMERLCNPGNSAVFVSMAHIQGPAELDIHAGNMDARQKRLYLASAFNLAKETVWPKGELAYVSRKSDVLLNMIDEKLTERVAARDDEPVERYIERIVRHEMRMVKIKDEQTRKFKQDLAQKRAP